MNAMQLFSSPSIEALGWSLVHSLWQGLICMVIALLVIRCIPSKWSTARYTVATVALLVTFFSSLATFLYLNSSIEHARVEAATPGYFSYQIENLNPETEHLAGSLQLLTSALQRYLPLIVILWSIGTLLFTIRLLGGWLTIKKLKKSAIIVGGQWNERLLHLANSLGIQEKVLLAESGIAQAPIVIGYFKPMILIPIGMFSGLSTEQLESIFLHELIHIRRRDYLVNLIQSLLEAIYFFNPFVWIMSGIIRREREHCCDDAVIAFHGNPLAYAHALTALEEVRLSRAGIALSFAENKNQLLNRIKRIMGKSAKPYSLRERMVPAILLLTGLICASWLTIQSSKTGELQSKQTSAEQNTVSSDTTIKIEKSGKYYRKSITTIGEDGKPHEEVVEGFDGDEDIRPLLAPMDFHASFPAIAAFPPVDMIDAIPPIPDINFNWNVMLDTVPSPINPDFHLYHRDWEQFGKEFETRFKEKFGDFYEKHQEEIQEMVKDLEMRFEDHSFEVADMMHLKALEGEMSKLQHEEMWTKHEEHLKDFAQNMERWSEQNAKHFEELDRQLKALEDSRVVFEKEFRDQLVKDGYLKDNEDLKSIEINDESIKINDKTIKDSDQKKYRELLKKNSFGELKWHEPPHPFPGRRE